VVEIDVDVLARRRGSAHRSAPARPALLRPAVDQLHRLRMLRMREDFARLRPARPGTPRSHHADAMTEPAHEVQVVRDEQDRHAELALQVSRAAR
jgi:hypothetical protein